MDLILSSVVFMCYSINDDIFLGLHDTSNEGGKHIVQMEDKQLETRTVIGTNAAHTLDMYTNIQYIFT